MIEKTRRYPRDILATACIPFSREGIFDQSKFKQLVEHLIARGVTQIYTFGTAGEGHTVSRTQFEEIVGLFAEIMSAPHLHPMVGIISLSPGETCERIALAYRQGIRDFQISLPSWGVLSDSEVLSYFHLVCDQFPDCRFMHYNTMRSGRMVDIPLYRILSEEIENLVAVKFITADIMKISALKAADLPLRIYFTEAGFAFGSMLGFDCGFLVSLASSNIIRARQWITAADSGALPLLLRYWEEMYDIMENFYRITEAGLTDGTYDKLFCRFAVPDFPQNMLPPYRGQSDPERIFNEYAAYLKQAHPEWLDETV